MKEIADLLNQHPEVSCTYTDTSLIFHKPEPFLILRYGERFLSIKDNQLINTSSRLSRLILLSLRKMGYSTDTNLEIVSILSGGQNYREYVLEKMSDMGLQINRKTCQEDSIYIDFLDSMVTVDVYSLDSVDIFDDFASVSGAGFEHAWSKYLEDRISYTEYTLKCLQEAQNEVSVEKNI